MSINVAILKVLSAYPEGHAEFAALRTDLAILCTREWLARMRALGANAGAIQLFTCGLAIRDKTGWTITAAGRAFLDALEDGRYDVARSIVHPPLRLIVTESSKPASHTFQPLESRATVTPDRVAS